ncbi:MULTISPECIES: VacJ family lipoprotein [Methylibium]|uniref:Putative lipoprotein n=1 Tax=Methylibium petroleiphilum (strain ATCC BAA-1232 / LMG 22953 / PM1) TaxID=420662 RepID=A2SKG2_METPP|nr:MULTISPECIES: VacJ family lipoprotein [Methylibium]ABM96051.1 putative lipoprotein [Methylibium petroleiphilum PM1]EWS57084.1 putative phospholipid-binding lipoprotein MlaA precursor [Methylibium sp. T29]EWS60571.1 putative phospholipid-binding lipoprotein MlaA precursor [Methylibium sp. T29-B]
MKSGVCRSAILAVALALGLVGCATVEQPDPLEKLNRKTFAFNETVDQYLIAPPARVYREVVPSVARQGIDNFFNNLRDVWSAFNLILQGRFGDSANDVMRFGTNTVFGLVGFVDWASALGLAPHYEDFGQTLGVWGFDAGAYLVLPVLGPSSARDAVGLPVDLLASPDQVVESVRLRNALTGLRVINTRAGLLDATGLLDDIALDKYSFVRDAYLQRRRSLVEDGRRRDAGAVEEDYVPDEPATPASAPAEPASAPVPQARP